MVATLGELIKRFPKCHSKYAVDLALLTLLSNTLYRSSLGPLALDSILPLPRPLFLDFILSLSPSNALPFGLRLRLPSRVCACCVLSCRA